MASHNPPLKKAKKHRKMPLSILGPIPSLNSTFYRWDELRMGNGISPCFFAFSRGQL